MPPLKLFSVLFVAVVVLLMTTCTLPLLAAPRPADSGSSDSLPFGVLDDASIFSTFRCRISLVNMTRRAFEPRLANCNFHF